MYMNLVFSVFPLVVFTTLSHAGVFECVDEAGRTVYRDAQCEAGEVLKQEIDIIALENKTNVSKVRVQDSGPLGKNLLKNPSFENRLIDWKAPLGAAWSSNQGVQGSGGLIIQAEIPPDDKYIHETTIEQCVPLGPGEKFQLKAKFKSETRLYGKYAKNVGIANRANVIWYETTDCSSGGQYGGYIEAENIPGWQDLRGASLMPAFQARAAKITIVQNGRHARGYKGYWDDISFFASEVFEQSSKKLNKPDSEHTLASNQNYVINSGFNSNLEGWHAWRAKWSARGNQSTGSAKVTFTSKKGGLGAGALDQCVNIGENTIFDFGARVKIDPASTQQGGGRIRVSWNDKENCSGRSKTDTHWDDVRDVDGWQTLEINDLVAPQGTHSAHLELIQTIKGPGRFSMYWDDVYFKAVGTEQLRTENQ